MSTANTAGLHASERTGGRRVRVDAYESDAHAWKFVHGQPDPRLRGCVIGEYGGWTERAAGIVRRRELPVILVPLILNLGDAFRVGPTADALDSYTSFVGGLSDRHVVVESARESRCIQVDLTPLGARRILGCSMQDLSNRVVELDDVLGAAGRRWIDQLAELEDWPARFDLLDAFLISRMREAPEVSADIAWALRRLERGDCRVGDLVREIGCGPKRLIERFRDQVGLAPKVIARIHRFTRAAGMLAGDDPVALVESALAAGYYDQSHLNRDFREFAGCTPTEFLRRRLPGGAGLADG